MSAVSIKVDPYDLENMEECTSPRNQKKSQENKRSCAGCCGMNRRLMITICIITTCAVLLAAGLTAYFLINPKPEPPITPSPTTASPSPTVSSNATTTTVTSPTTPCIPIRWLEDLTIRLANHKDHRRVSLFNGPVSHSDMRIVCDKIDNDRSLQNEDFESGRYASYRGLFNFDNPEEEASFNEIIQSYDSMNSGDKTIFGNLPAGMRLVWNGCYYVYNEDKRIWDNECPQNLLDDYNNFCDRLGWVKELTDLQSSATKDKIFIVKDYRGDNKGCWQLYTEEQILSIMGSNGISARLPFACITANMSSISGQDALTQSDIPCY